MKAVLITLSGSEDAGRGILHEKWPTADVVVMPRAILSEGTYLQRLQQVRAVGPDIFAIMTEAVAWQYGKRALLLFGALSGARHNVILDARGDIRAASRPEALIKFPPLIAREAIAGKAALRDAAENVKTLEKLTPPLEYYRSNGRTRVLYFRTTPAAGTVPGGATSHINGVVNGLRQLEAEVSFASNDLIAGVEDNDAFRLLHPDRECMPRAAFDVANGLSFSKRAAKIAASVRPSFIYERYSRFSLAGVEASIEAKVPLFLEYNGSEVWVGKHWDSTAKLDLLERYEDLSLAKATRIFVVSDVERRTLISRGVPESKIVLNPNGVDPEKFKPKIGGAAVRERLGIGRDERVAGFLGTFGPWHGVLTLAEAISKIPKDAGIKFLLIGDGSLRADVERRLGETDDLDRVTFVGSVAHEKVPAYLDACDILISPHVPLAQGAEFFGSPTKLFEYMAMGKAIVASRLGQISEVLSHRISALLVEPGNAEELAAALIEAADDQGLSEKLGLAARERVIEKHTWQENAKIVLDTYEGLTK